jgi:hypothetical protein
MLLAKSKLFKEIEKSKKKNQQKKERKKPLGYFNSSM